MTKTFMTQLRITPLNRPIENHDWMNTPITPERQAASEAWQKQYAALRQQFESEWVPPPGYSAERDLEEMENIESAAFTVWEERRKGRIAAASTPVWVDAFEYWLVDGPGFESNGMLAKQPTAVSLTLPIVLKGGGDMQVTFETKKVRRYEIRSGATHLDRAASTGSSSGPSTASSSGHLESECGERNWYVISLPPNAPQAVADRIANTLDAINELNLADDYLTVMPVSDRCSICTRPLTDIVWKTLGIGPDCSRESA